MKKKNILLLFILFIQFSNCFSQQLMETVNDLQKIKDNQSQFINKPLKDLLKEIKPPIKRVTGNPRKYNHEGMGYFVFNFEDNKQKDSLSMENKIPATMVVYVNEYFDWDLHSRPKGKETIWTSEDALKYENLTIVAFRIYGNGVTSK